MARTGEILRKEVKMGAPSCPTSSTARIREDEVVRGTAATEVATILPPPSALPSVAEPSVVPAEIPPSRPAVPEMGGEGTSVAPPRVHVVPVVPSA